MDVCEAERYIRFQPLFCLQTGQGSDSSSQTAAHKLTIWTGMVFIVGEMAGSGLLALPKAVENTGQ